MDEPRSHLKRERHAIPTDVAAALDAEELWSSFHGRPEYQQNDYVGWIVRAKRPETREKRLRQMIDELKSGGVYMKMRHPPSDRIRRSEARPGTSTE